MTTVAYDGEFLAVDSQSTANPPGDHYCSECDGKLKKLIKFGNKLHVGRGRVTFQDQNVVAWAGAGSASNISGFCAALRRGVKIEDAFEILKVGVHKGGITSDSVLFIVTDSSAWELEIFPGGTELKEITKFPYAVGTGASAAKLAMQRLGLTAMAAVALAIDSDALSGGPVTYVNCRHPDPTPERHLYTEEDILELIEQI